MVSLIFDTVKVHSIGARQCDFFKEIGQPGKSKIELPRVKPILRRQKLRTFQPRGHPGENKSVKTFSLNPAI